MLLKKIQWHILESDTMKKLLIIGAGGHGKVVCDIAKCTKMFDEIIFLDDDTEKKNVLGYSVYGQTTCYEALRYTYTYATVAVGNNKIRMQWLDRLTQAGYKLPILVHPTAVVSDYATIHEGTVIMSHVVVNAGATVGRGCILNTSSVVEHDCCVEDGVHISPMAVLGGTVSVGRESWIGLGAKVINNITIGERVRIGAGAVVVQNIQDDVTAVGIPARAR